MRKMRAQEKSLAARVANSPQGGQILLAIYGFSRFVGKWYNSHAIFVARSNATSKRRRFLCDFWCDICCDLL